MKLPGYQEYYDSLNHWDQKRIQFMQWDLLMEDFADGLDFVAGVCWHEAVDRARAAGIKARADPDDETPSRVTGPHAAAFHANDRLIDRDLNGNEVENTAKPASKPAKIRKVPVITAEAVDRETEKYFSF